MAVGTVVTLGTMAVVGDVLANEPIYFGLASSLLVYVVVSLLSKPTASDVMAEWDRRSRGRAHRDRAHDGGDNIVRRCKVYACRFADRGGRSVDRCVDS